MDINVLLLHGSFVLYGISVLLYVANARLHWPRLHQLALGSVLVAFGGQSLYLGLRWFAAGYLPVTNLFSTMFFFSWSLAATYVYFEWRYRLAGAGLFVMLLNLILLYIALPRDPAIPALIPMLDTPLFTLHVAFSFLGYALFAMAFSLGVLYLLQRKTSALLLPSSDMLKQLNEEAVFLGFCFFTLSMLFGSYWAYVAWGYYFSWNIKALWSALIWLYFAGMCHAKFIGRWQGTGYAWLSIVGFVLVLFTYLGIGLLMNSNHPLA
ncbi:MAG: cytochrome c biogenesis protein CcsA [Desulfuromonadaceae bacterium]|nr:cytochrome c biogenesis protein CcsA [Desulfuromonadaceae bacterium]